MASMLWPVLGLQLIPLKSHLEVHSWFTKHRMTWLHNTFLTCLLILSAADCSKHLVGEISPLQEWNQKCGEAAFKSLCPGTMQQPAR